MNEKIHGYQASGNANQSGEEDEPEIMLFGKKGIERGTRVTNVLRRPNVAVSSEPLPSHQQAINMRDCVSPRSKSALRY